MSNAVDILVLDGPHAGVWLCQPRPVPATIEHDGAAYNHFEFHDHVGLKAYHFFAQDITAEDVADLLLVIDAYSIQPAWDLTYTPLPPEEE